MDVKFTDNRKEVLDQLEAACLRALAGVSAVLSPLTSVAGLPELKEE